ncbi:DinB family protein [Miniimonas sp. S16]|uniref:DinB family protein n=1 Tax=Miniimonas sp. S16 TaxID=2171623 RepID=UPI000D5274B0|nr:DinB family protein [Miniimonas sp. S16]
MTLTDELLEQHTWHWDHQLRPRLEGLTDAEYLWPPVADSWTVRPRGEHGPWGTIGSGSGVVDFEVPEPVPAPVTTIAWRLAHLVVGVFGDRNARYFGGPEISYDSYDYPLTAAASLADLDAGEARWRAGVAALDDVALAEPCREPGHEDSSMAGLVLHIHREVIHHGAEIALLRDLYLRQG